MLYEIKNLVKQRGGARDYKLLVRNLHIHRGTRIAVTGPSGCGKSTFLDLLGLALSPNTAEQFLFTPEEQPLDILQFWQKKQHDFMSNLRLKYIGYVLQTGDLLPFLTVLENMTLIARMSGLAPELAIENALTLANKLGIAHLLKAMPATLSVGERQRAAIVRALTPKPQLILADEPTAALDPHHAEKVMEAFLQALEEQDGTLILVTHNADNVKRANFQELVFTLKQEEQGVLAILDGTQIMESSEC